MLSLFKSTALLFGLASPIAAQVIGAADGFARGVTGGGDATPIYPNTNEELVALLESDEPQVIVLNKEFNFLGTEGTTTEEGCAPWGTGDGCQLAINANGWCGDNPAATVTYDNAPGNQIYVKSDKTLVGEGSAGVIRGKSLYIDRQSNIIIQNIHVTDLNPQYVWGGDAFVLYGSDLVWIDHCQTSLIGRQHFVTGFNPNTRVTISSHFADGRTDWSAGCNGYHYWTLEMIGTDDQITWWNNYVYHTSGRGPALSGNSLFHAVNSVWEDIDGHAIEGGDGEATGLFEGCVFIDVNEVVASGATNTLFSASSSNSGDCQAALGRACEPNMLENSGAFDNSDSSFFGDFGDLPVVGVGSAESARDWVPANAGIGKI